MKSKIVGFLSLIIILSSCQKAIVNEPSAFTLSELSKSSVVSLNTSPSNAFYDNALGQTPIDIVTKNTVKYKGNDPVFHYVSFDGIVSNNKTHYAADPFIEIPAEHDEYNLKVSVPAANKDNYITINGTKFYLLQFHFHWLSEHTIDGKDGLMEVHFVHQSDAGQLSVIGVLIQGGEKNKNLQKLFTVSPLNFGDLNATVAAFNPLNLLPENRQDYFTYSGSLTTPGGGLTVTPYLTGLKWFVFKAPIYLSNIQYNQYKSVYPEANARPVQMLGARVVYHHMAN